MKLRKILLLGLFVLYLAVPAVVGIFGQPGLGRGMFFIDQLSRLGALLGLALFGVQFALGLKLKFIEPYFGHDKMVAWHRKIGIIALVLILFHALVALQVSAGRNEAGLLLGVTALFLFLITLLFILIHKVLHTRYEYWEVAHQLNYVLFPMAFIHSLLLGSSVRGSLVWQILWAIIGAGFLGILGYKIVHSFRVRHTRFEVADVVQETANIWTIHFQPKPFHFSPGQFMVLRLVRDGAVSEPHPFTIASSPTAAALAVSIKEAGDFTGQVGRIHAGDYALIDAPYGRFSFLEYPAAKYLFIAGGIGITPFLSMLRYMRDQKVATPVLLLWGNRTATDIAFGEELAQMEQTMPGLTVVHILSEQMEWAGETGFIDAALLKKYGGNLGEQEIFLCGPPLMMKMVRKALQSLNVPGRRIHYERFTW